MTDDYCINCGSPLRGEYCPNCDKHIVITHEELYAQDNYLDDDMMESPCNSCHGENDHDCQKTCYLYRKYLRKLKKY